MEDIGGPNINGALFATAATEHGKSGECWFDVLGLDRNPPSLKT